MEKTLLRERYDANLGSTIRMYELQNGQNQYTLQKRGQTANPLLCLEKPIYAHISLTNKCNLKCPYCYANDSNDGSDMGTDDVLQLIDLCSLNGIFSITWTGGEPFTRKDLMLFVQKANEKGIHQSILTNGTCIPEGFLENAPKRNVFYQFSLNQAWSNASVDQKNHEKVFEQVRKCTSLKIGNVVTIMLEPKKINEIEALIQRLISNGITAVRLGFLMPIGRGNERFYEDYLKNIVKAIPLYNQLKEKYKNEITIFYQFDKKNFSYKGFPRRFFMCEAGTTLMYIDNNGDVFPCPLFKSDSHFYCGNIFKEDWMELWHKPQMLQLRKIPECTNCSYECKTWCRAMKYFYDYNLSGKGICCLKSI